MEYKVCKTSEIKAADDTNLILDHFISTETQDDGGDVLLADGMVVRGKPVVLFQHGFDFSKGSEPIAKPISITVGTNSKGVKGIIARTQYFPDEQGKRLYQKSKQGYMPNWSVGWNPLEQEPITGGGRLVRKWQLMEYSMVAVGMNADAATETYKTYDAIGLQYKQCENCTSCGKCAEKFKEPCKDGACCRDITEEEKALTPPEHKPYPNEHACRLVEPVKGAKTRRANGERDHEGKKYDVIYQEQDGKWVEQAFRYPKEAWTAADARAHCKSHDGILFEPASEKALESKGCGGSGRERLRAHKALVHLHGLMVSDLKEAASAESFVDEGAKAAATSVLEDFEDNVPPHVVKYLKAVTEMEGTEEFDDKGFESFLKDFPALEAKGYQTHHNSLNKVFGEMVASIRSFKCKKETNVEKEGGKIIKAHGEAALPHAVEFVKAYAQKLSEDKKALQHKEPDPAAPEPAAVLELTPPATMLIVDNTKEAPPAEPTISLPCTAEELKQMMTEHFSRATEAALQKTERKLQGKLD